MPRQSAAGASGSGTGSSKSSEVIESARTKELVAAVSSLLAGENPDHIRRQHYASLVHVDVSHGQNYPVTRAMLDDSLGPARFLNTAVSFLPRKVLEANANNMLQRTRFDDPTSLYARIYSYAMLPIYNARRRGDGTETWKYVDDDKKERWVNDKFSNILVQECVYNADGKVDGWFLYSYDNVRPRSDPAVYKRLRKQRAQAIKDGFKRAKVIFQNQGASPAIAAVNQMDSEIRGTIMTQLMAVPGFFDENGEGPPGLDPSPNAVAAPEAQNQARVAEAEDAEAKAAVDPVAEAIEEEEHVKPRKPQIKDHSFQQWMYNMLHNRDFGVDEFTGLWRDAKICPKDAEDLLATMRIVMQFAYNDVDPVLMQQLEDTSRFQFDEFRPDNFTGPLAPLRIYSMETAVLVKRRMCGHAVDAHGAMSLEREIELHHELPGSEAEEKFGNYPAPREPSHAVILPPSASNIIDGLFRNLLLDVTSTVKEKAAKIRQISMTVPPVVMPAARSAMQTMRMELSAWHPFVLRVRRHMDYRAQRNGETANSTLAQCLSFCGEFDAHFQEYTPGMGFLGKVAKHWNDHKTSIFDKISIPHGDHEGDKDMDIGLQYMRRTVQRVAKLSNNPKNAHVIGLGFSAITDSSRHNPTATMEAMHPLLLILGPTGLGKTALMRFLMRCMIDGTADWISRDTECVTGNSDDNFGSGAEFRDEVDHETCGVMSENCSEHAVKRIAASSTGCAPELMGSKKYDHMKQRSTHAQNLTRTQAVKEGGHRVVNRAMTMQAIATFMSANTPMFAFPGTMVTRMNRTHMANNTAEVINFVLDEARCSELWAELHDMQAIESAIYWQINPGLLPRPPMQHISDFYEALYSQLAHENPSANRFGDNRSWGRCKMECWAMVIRRASVLMALTGVGRDEMGHASTEYMIRELRPLLFPPLTYAIYAAELYSVAAPRIYIDVVAGLLSIMGANYNAETGLCEVDRDYWEAKEEHKRPAGNCTIQGNYIMRSGFLAGQGNNHGNRQQQQPRNRRDPSQPLEADGKNDDNNNDSGSNSQSASIQNDSLNILSQAIYKIIGDRYPFVDVLGVLTSLTCNFCRNRDPGFDFDRRSSVHQQTPMPGLRIAHNGTIEVHQRVFWMFHRDYFKNLVLGMQTPKSTLGKGMRGVADDKGLFEIVEWAGPDAWSAAKINTDLKIVRADLHKAREEAKKVRAENVRLSKAPLQRTDSAFAMNARNTMRTQRLALLQTALDKIKLLEDAEVAVGEHHISYNEWRELKKLNAIRPAGTGRFHPVRDWADYERQHHAAWLRRFSALQLDQHWFAKVKTIQFAYGATVEASKKLVDYVRDASMPHNTLRGPFMMLLDKSTHSIQTFVSFIQSLSSSLRPITVHVARHMWHNQVGNTLLCPPLVNIIQSTQMTPAVHEILTQMCRETFIMHRELHHVRRLWLSIVDTVKNQSALQGGITNLYKLREPDSVIAAPVRQMAENICFTVRGCVHKINDLAASMGSVNVIDYKIAMQLVMDVDCSDQLAFHIQRAEVADAEHVQQVVDVILNAADVPHADAIESIAVTAVRVSNENDMMPESDSQPLDEPMSSSSSSDLEIDVFPPPPPPLPPTTLLPTRRQVTRSSSNSVISEEEQQEGGEQQDLDGLSEILEEEQELRDAGDLCVPEEQPIPTEMDVDA